MTLMRAQVDTFAREHARKKAAEYAGRNGLTADAHTVRMPHEKAVQEFGDGEQEANPWVNESLREFGRMLGG